MTNFREILDQSWNSEIHKVKLLKLQNFNFDLKFLWNLSVFHHEPKVLDLKKVFSNLEPEGQGRGIIMGVTRLLLLRSFYYIQTNFLYFFAHDCSLFFLFSDSSILFEDTVFTRIVSAETILFWIWPYLLWPLTFTSWTWIVAAETIQGRKLFKGGNYSRKYGNEVWLCELINFWKSWLFYGHSKTKGKA